MAKNAKVLNANYRARVKNLMNETLNDVTTSVEVAANNHVHIVASNYIKQQVEHYAINEGY